MTCPYLAEVNMRYCRAYPIKKMIPASSGQALSPCLTNAHVSCPVYNEVSQWDEQRREKRFRPIAAREEQATAPGEQRSPAVEGKNFCVWLSQEIVSYRLCTKDYQCDKCEFHQTLADKDAQYVESPDLARLVANLRSLPASQRRCKYQVIGKVLYHSCDYQYECWRCPGYRTIRENIVEQPAGIVHEL